MRYLEDDFDLEAFKKSHYANQTQSAPVKRGNIFTRFALTIVELALAFATAYVLFRGGQFLIDLFLDIP